MEKSEATLFLPVILTIFAAFGIAPAAAQKLDSLKRVLDNQRAELKCDVLAQISYEFLDVDNDSALHYARTAFACALTYKDTAQMVRSTDLMSRAFRRLGDHDSAIIVVQKILPIARGNQNEVLADLLHGLALAHLFKAEFPDALRYNFESLELRNPNDAPYTISNIGFTYYKLADYTKAIGYYQMAIDSLSKYDKDIDRLAMLHVNIGLCYTYLGDIAKAESSVEKGLGICDRDCKTDVIIQADFCLGIANLSKGDSLTAERYFLDSYANASFLNDDRMKLDNVIFLTKINFGKKNYTEASKKLKQAEALVAKGTPYSMELMKIYSEFVDLYEARRDYPKVAEFQKKYISLRDKIYDDEVTTSLMRIEVDYVEREKNAQIETQRKLLSLNSEVIAKQRIINVFLVITIALFIAVTILLVHSIRDKKRRNKDLEERVRKRTIELEQNSNLLHMQLDQKDLHMVRWADSIRHGVASIQGLCSLVDRDDPSQQTSECIGRIERVAVRLLDDARRYLTMSTAGKEKA